MTASETCCAPHVSESQDKAYVLIDSMARTQAVLFSRADGSDEVPVQVRQLSTEVEELIRNRSHATTEQKK